MYTNYKKSMMHRRVWACGIACIERRSSRVQAAMYCRRQGWCHSSEQASIFADKSSADTDVLWRLHLGDSVNCCCHDDSVLLLQGRVSKPQSLSGYRSLICLLRQYDRRRRIYMRPIKARVCQVSNRYRVLVTHWPDAVCSGSNTDYRCRC